MVKFDVVLGKSKTAVEGKGLWRRKKIQGEASVGKTERMGGLGNGSAAMCPG